MAKKGIKGRHLYADTKTLDSVKTKSFKYTAAETVIKSVNITPIIKLVFILLLISLVSRTLVNIDAESISFTGFLHLLNDVPQVKFTDNDNVFTYLGKAFGSLITYISFFARFLFGI